MYKVNFYNFTRRIYGKGCNVLSKYIIEKLFLMLINYFV
ncbi:hypothetical protein CLRAG_32950 [Clostridium ragsdalei P11]|uniref:Uncharacterized protein n=1 Tax=Clostridium ragsdalei P11 TaxID=1353534 RepID=A0A1A6AKN9_9CLOT|nr:hypothetical protein CLRAG_32950 [Clostridium ragsdalei P11]